MTMVVFYLFLLPLMLIQTPVHERPLPDQEGFLASVRERIEKVREYELTYIYEQESVVRELDSHGRVKKMESRRHEIFPLGDESFRRLIAKDGHPLSAEELARQDREWDRKKVRLEREKRDGAYQRKVETSRARQREDFQDILAVTEVSIVRREQLGGRDTIVCTFAPRPGAKPRTRSGRMIHGMTGEIWIDEAERELVRLEAEVIRDIKFGAGLLGKVGRGSRLAFERAQINEDMWVPHSARVYFRARFLFKGFHREITTIFENFRQAAVETSIDFQPL